ncbi:MAG: UDP-glucose/GDP-mannose dehydrogenase family protein [Candidatus Eremiobacteraeota bacterium]|nr:UDP-glucose/GDP-mannose dehydrogenase family protein [Candidatus Eremiobacteraeota bacterium]MBV8282919.1 UDP-glucose/GDP-mannose dehydrogenase family protein [Candidatus Eremiobacteraeota bacterium]
MHRVAVIGTGYVGLVAGACLAELGNDVACIDVDAAKIATLQLGRSPFFEPGLDELAQRNRQAGRLAFTTDLPAGILERDIVVIAVGTPTTDEGHLDLRHVRQAALDIAAALDGPKIVVNKSTVPVQTADLVHSLIEEAKAADHAVTVVSNPEFMREGSAVADFMHPDRIVIGVDHPGAEAVLRDLYAPFGAPIIVTDPRTAEMIKLTSNAFLAAKISFINEIAAVCDLVGADVRDVVTGVGADARIGAACMQPGLGFGGSCLPKDVLALHRIAARTGASTRLLDAALAVNAAQVEHVISRLATLLDGLDHKTIGVLGLAFKPGTDDVRESPALVLARGLAGRGARVQAHDPVAVANAAAELGDAVAFVDGPYDVATGADALVLATAWNEYTELDLGDLRRRMRGDVLFDARDLYDPRKVSAAGFTYAGIGRRAPATARAVAP